MEDQPYYSRRLATEELDVWIRLRQTDIPEDDYDAAQTYIHLDGSMFFISYLGDEEAGASTIFRDTARMGLLLSSIRIPEKSRLRLTKHIVKTSLPFFKSVAIREVDAFVNPAYDMKSIPFPFCTDLGAWTEEALIENGFKEIALFQRATYAIPDKIEIPSTLKWDSPSAETETLKQLFWKVSPNERPDHGCFWLSVILAQKASSHYSVSVDNEPQLSIGTQTWNNTFLITSLLSDPSEVSSQDVALRIISLAKQRGLSSVTLNMMPSDSQVLNAMSSLCGDAIDVSELKLYRKAL
ncbi:MAG: hypothetical protein ACFFED_02925 [Candidatus Thorarchaeota archaeon]